MEDLKNNFSQQIRFAEKRPGITQLIGPFFHDDGDMLDIFLRPATDTDPMKITDCGMTLMRLSYSYDLETEARRKIFQRILAESGAAESDGEIYVEAKPAELYAGLMRFVQTVTKVSNMRLS